MKKKILYIIEAMSGGAGRHVQDLILNLDTENYEIYCIYSEGRLDSRFLSQKSNLDLKANMIVCNYLRRELNLAKDLKAFNFIKREIKKINPDIVHCHSSKAGAIGRLAAKICGVKKIFYTPHAYSFLAPEFSKKKKQLFIIIEKFLSRYATSKTFCVSKSEKEAALTNGIDSEGKFTVIYNGLPDIHLPSKNEVRKKLNLPIDAIVIGNNARLSEQKNPMLFMKIAKEIVAEGKNYHFVWAGEGPLKVEVESFIKENMLEGNVHLLGDRNDTEFLVAGYDIFLLTSLYEGLPYAPIEAMRARVPILAKKIDVVEEFIKIKVTGNVFNSKINLNLLRSTMNLSGDDIDDLFYSSFSLTKMMNMIEEEYQQL